MRRVISGFVAVVVIASAAQLCAQTTPHSLPDYLRAALKENPLVRSAEATQESAQYYSHSVRESFYPQVAVGSHVIAAPGYDQAITNGGELAAQISGSYMLYDGGVKSLETQSGDVGVEQSNLNRTRTIADIVYAVSISYVSAVKQKRELGVVTEEYNALNEYLQLIKQLHASGQGSETDLLKTTVDLNNAGIDIATRRTSYANALIALAQASGLPSSEVTDVDTSTVPLEYDTTFSGAKNVDIEGQRLALQQAKLQAGIVASRMRPVVSLGADAGMFTSLPNLRNGLANVFGASVGVSVSLPIFTIGSLEDSYKASEAAAKSLFLQNQYNESSIERQFEATLNDISSADSQITAQHGNLVVARQNMIISKARYAGGSGLSLEVLNAIQMVNQIELSIEEARAARELGVLKLNRLNYTGVN